MALLIPQVLGQLRGQAALQGLLEQRGQQALAARHLDLASIKTLKQRIQRTRAAKLLHGLTPTSASHNNIIIIHHASILSNKMTDTQTIEHAQPIHDIVTYPRVHATRLTSTLLHIDAPRLPRRQPLSPHASSARIVYTGTRTNTATVATNPTGGPLGPTMRTLTR